MQVTADPRRQDRSDPGRPAAGLPARMEKACVYTLAASFTLPVLIWLGIWTTHDRSFATVWFRNVTLHGIQPRAEAVPCSPATVLSGRFQAACAQRFDLNFAGRELCIRLISELYLRAFHATSAQVVVGPRLSLVEPVYLTDYCLLRPDKDALRPLAGDLRRLQDLCDARGTAFALVITPSKAAIYPEGIPAAWLRRRLPGPRYYDTFLPLLREQGIRYVDGHRIALGLKAAAATPLFPLGGVHWGDAPALATTNALLELLAGRGLGVEPARQYVASVSHHPTGQDRDLADLINNLLPWNYPVMRVSVPPVPRPPGDRPDAVLVGGSFTWSLLRMLDATRQFSELDFYHYYHVAKYCRHDGDQQLLAQPAPTPDFEHEVFAADALVLEVNEQALHEPRHLVDFLHDALAARPDPHAPRAAFHYESRMQYRWGDTLSLVADDHTMNMAATLGFAPSGPIGSYTVGPVSAILFSAPPPPGDMVLEVDARPYLVDTRLREQRVAVLVNGHPVGDWRWNVPRASRRELTIPRDFLGSGGGEVRLEFRFARPGSPSEFGLGTDTRKFALIISRVRLHEAGK